MVTGRGTGFLVWHGCTRCLVPRVSREPITCPAMTGQWGGSECGVLDPHQNLWPISRSRIAENSAKLPQLSSIFQLLAAGTSAPLCYFTAAFLSPLSKIPLVLFSSSLCPNLTTTEKNEMYWLPQDLCAHGGSQAAQ